MIEPGIEQALRGLSAEDRRHAVEILTGSVGAAPVSAADRFTALTGIIETVTGEPLTLGNRDARMVWRRAIIAYQMANEGFTEAQIGDAMKRDHSTVNYLKHRMADALTVPAAYKDVMHTYRAFLEAV